MCFDFLGHGSWRSNVRVIQEIRIKHGSSAHLPCSAQVQAYATGSSTAGLSAQLSESHVYEQQGVLSPYR